MPKAVVKEWPEPGQILWPDADTGPWSVTLLWRQHARKIVCTGVHIELLIEADAEPITTTLLRAVPIAHLIRAAREARFYAEGGGLYDATADEQREAIGRTLRKSDAALDPWAGSGQPRLRAHDQGDFEKVAEVYRDADTAGVPPTVAVGRYFQVEHAQASRLVREARDRGLLEPYKRRSRRVESTPDGPTRRAQASSSAAARPSTSTGSRSRKAMP